MHAAIFSRSVVSQFNSALRMLEDCLKQCPDRLWDEPVGTLPFWEVAYHTLCWTDMYLSASKQAWQPAPGPGQRRKGQTPLTAHSLHPTGIQEMWGRHPSRRFERLELLHYAALCKKKVRAVLDAETDRTLAGPSGFRWIKGPRAEAHLYNLRHLSGHVGQLTGFLWKHGVPTRWVRAAR